MSDFRADIPESLENIVCKAMQKNIEDRDQMGLEFATYLSRAFDNLEAKQEDISAEEKFNMIKKLEFFQGFPDAEIWEILRASNWQEYKPGEDIIVEGELDDCFYIIVTGKVEVKKNDKTIRTLHIGDCFGEIGYLAKTKRTASIVAENSTALIKINSTVIS